MGYGLHTLHHRQQLLLLTLQQSVLLPQLVAKLGLVCWLHVVRVYCYDRARSQIQNQGIFQRRSVYSQSKVSNQVIKYKAEHTAIGSSDKMGR